MSDTSQQKDKQTDGQTREPEEIRADIEQTREELGDTAAAVAEKADVKAQASAKVDEVKQQAAGKAQEAKDKAKEATDQAAAKAKEIAPESAGPTIEKAQRFVNEKPLVALGVALAAVVLLGRALSR
jgi:ElaB/YqjD/DUF883 family membrane-anchored ribosome-binding protein